MSEHGKTLAVRDFSYTADQQSMMINAASRCSDQIVISLKNTPHDYYPTFPNNPRIGNTNGLRQWIEFDTWGQFFGMGFFPVSVAEDMQKRMQHCYEQGAEGIFLRTDWEVITDAGSFNSFNIFNVIAGAMLSQNIDMDLDKAYEAWARYGLCSPMHEASDLQPPAAPSGADAVHALKQFMKASWSVMEKAVYVRGHLFHEDGQFPDSVKKAFAMMVDIHGRDEWEPGASKLVEPTDENLPIIFAEKEQAVKEVRALPDILRPDSLGIPRGMAEELKVILELYECYVRGYQLCAKAVFLTRKAQISGSEADAALARETINPLREFRNELIDRLRGTHYPHYVYWLLDEKRIELLIRDIEAQLA